MSTIEKALNKVDTRKQVRGDDNGTAASGVTELSRRAHSPGAVAEVTTGSTPPKTQKPVHVDFTRLEAKGIYAPDDLDVNIRDEFRRIKRPLLSNAFGKGALLVDNGNLIVVTSSLPGEGKTFTAASLALSITLERDHTVLLVDADAAKPDMTHLFGLEKRRGLSDVLLDKSVSLGDVLVRTDIPDLTLLPSGALHSQMVELLASKRMEQIVAELGQRYHDRVIIFDAPPVLASSEAQLLTQLAGQIVFIVQAGETPQHVVQEAIETLDESKAIGLVLNQTQNIFGKNYSDYYGYGNRESGK
jgi:exopolysaccharide/PEP-CTERM locus tyrosine autokinase